MSTNYSSARVAMGVALLACQSDPGECVERYLPEMPDWDVCTPEHLTAALGLAGLDVVLIESPAIGAVVHDAIRQGYLAICCSGLHSLPHQQRWQVAYRHQGQMVEMIGGGFEDAFLCPEPAHFRPYCIVVKGRSDMPDSSYAPVGGDID